MAQSPLPYPVESFLFICIRPSRERRYSRLNRFKWWRPKESWTTAGILDD
jgi:hypothetical protein